MYYVRVPRSEKTDLFWTLPSAMAAGEARITIDCMRFGCWTATAIPGEIVSQTGHSWGSVRSGKTYAVAATAGQPSERTYCCLLAMFFHFVKRRTTIANDRNGNLGFGPSRDCEPGTNGNSGNYVRKILLPARIKVT